MLCRGDGKGKPFSIIRVIAMDPVDEMERLLVCLAVM